MSSPNSTLLKGMNIIAFVLTVLVNGLAGSTTLLGGKFTAEISDMNPKLITPAGYVFRFGRYLHLAWDFRSISNIAQREKKRLSK
jgi:hypothetical protein